VGYGVIGNTEDSDSFVLGSSPGTPADVGLLKAWEMKTRSAVVQAGQAHLLERLGRHPGFCRWLLAG
jgi:hypothetical protein